MTKYGRAIQCIADHHSIAAKDVAILLEAAMGGGAKSRERWAEMARRVVNGYSGKAWLVFNAPQEAGVSVLADGKMELTLDAGIDARRRE